MSRVTYLECESIGLPPCGVAAANDDDIAQLHSALRSVSHRDVVAGQDFDHHRIDGYQSS
jgi:hypothetical protein